MTEFVTIPGDGENIATDEILTLNGGAAPADLKVQRAKVGYGPDSELRDVDADHPLPSEDAAAATLLTAINNLSDAMLYFSTAILRKMPRIDANDRLIASIEAGTLPAVTTVSTVTGVTTVATVTNMTNLNNLAGGNTAPIPFQISNMGALHLYQNIGVS